MRRTGYEDCICENKSHKPWVLCTKLSTQLNRKIAVGLNLFVLAFSTVAVALGLVITNFRDVHNTHSIGTACTALGVLMVICALWGIFNAKASTNTFLYLHMASVSVCSVVDMIMAGFIIHKLATIPCKACTVMVVLVVVSLAFIVLCFVHVLVVLWTYVLTLDYGCEHNCGVVTQPHNNNYITNTGSQEIQYTEVLVHGETRGLPLHHQQSWARLPWHHTASHHNSMDSIASRAKRRGIAFVDKDEISLDCPSSTVLPDRSQSCDHLSSATHQEIQDADIRTHIMGEDCTQVVNRSIPSRSSRHQISHTSDLYHRHLTDFRDDISDSRICDDSVFLEMPNSHYYNQHSFRSDVIGIQSLNESAIKEANTSRYKQSVQNRKRSADFFHSLQNTSAPNLKVQVFKKRTPREVKRHKLHMITKNTDTILTLKSQQKSELKEQDISLDKSCNSMIDKAAMDYDDNVYSNHLSKRRNRQTNFAFMSLPGLHYGEHINPYYNYTHKKERSRAKSLESVYKLTGNRTEHSALRPLSHAESSTHTLMKSIFSGTYWKDHGPDQSITSIDGTASLMTSKSSFTQPLSVNSLTMINEENSPQTHHCSVDEDTSSVLSKSCVDIDNSGTSSGLAPSFLRKSVIDPSVAQSFQRSLYHTPKYYTTPSKYLSPVKLRQYHSQMFDTPVGADDDSSFASFHTARGVKHDRLTHLENSYNTTLNTSTVSSCIPSYNFDQQLDKCLSQMMLLAAELQNKENSHSDSHMEAGIEVSPLTSNNKSRSLTNIRTFVRYGESPVIPTVMFAGQLPSMMYRPHSRDSGSVTSQFSARGTPTPHNNSRFSAESMII